MYTLLLGAHQQALASDLERKLGLDFLVHNVAHSWQAVESFRQRHYDGFLLDSSLPVAGGFSACEELRNIGCADAIFIVGPSDLIENHERAFLSGADGYVCSALGTKDVSARMQAAIRRRVPNGYKTKLCWHDITIDLEQRWVTGRNSGVRLRPREMALLQHLMRNQNVLFTSDQLWHEVWKKPGVASDTVRTHVNTLRSKLEEVGAREMIQTVHGLGYKVVP